jgi:hypothetical protein
VQAAVSVFGFKESMFPIFVLSGTQQAVRVYCLSVHGASLLLGLRCEGECSGRCALRLDRRLLHECRLLRTHRLLRLPFNANPSLTSHTGVEPDSEPPAARCWDLWGVGRVGGTSASRAWCACMSCSGRGSQQRQRHRLLLLKSFHVLSPRLRTTHACAHTAGRCSDIRKLLTLPQHS